MASAVEDALKRFRRRLVDRETAAFHELIEAYTLAALEIRKEIDKLADAIEADRKTGRAITQWRIAREKYLRDFLSAIEKEIKKYGGTVDRVVSFQQQRAVLDAIAEAEAMAGVKVRATFSRRMVQNAVGMMGEGSPIAEYWNSQVAPTVVNAMQEEIIKAAIFGRPFDRIARRLIATGDITRQRALSFARTEVNRVRRETTREIYQENSDRIKGWEWLAVHSVLTCIVCIAMDGTIFELNEPFPQHINCRCRMIPVLRHRPSRQRKLAREWFAQQPDEIKEKILGKHAFEAFIRGDVMLDDFVGWKTSKEFGKSVYRRSLAEIIRAKGMETAGAGGNWPRTNERFNRSIVKQADDISCVAAAGEMLAREYGLRIEQEKILADIGSLANAEKLADFLNRHTAERWRGGSVDPDQGLDTIVKFVKENRAVTAILREGSPVGHAVLVKGTNKAGLIRVWDPWDQTSYTMDPKDFLDVFSEFVQKQ